ncbi:hypothetical protein BD626DRAFT_502641 [Schizophyllum amplum]|uniref:BPL/LPL catalytic domain-containing protein n=1 Tax=Schizophyllum amplum TaxID=97359 RepID=A0A550C8E7_9AGAR|nr:hypothetical protein BD626DRAFT_502641 [Auriculariopsis ampla]
MNVLVYGAPDSAALSLLRAALIPHYAVQPLSASALAGQPWNVNCALLVVPKANDLNSVKAITAIQSYVRDGGAFLGLSTGAVLSKTAASGIEAGLQLYVRPGGYLRFDSEKLRQSVGDTSSVADGVSSQASTVSVEDLAGNVAHSVRLDPLNILDGFSKEEGAETVLRYTSSDSKEGPSSSPAAVALKVGSGRVAVVAPSLEDSTSISSSLFPSQSPPSPSPTSPTSHNSTLPLLLPVLASLGLRVSSSATVSPSKTSARPQPQFLTSHPGRPDIVERIVKALAVAQAEESGASMKQGGNSATPIATLAEQLSVWEDTEDTFHFYPLAGAADAVRAAQGELDANSSVNDSKSVANTSKPSSETSKSSPRHIVLCPSSALPPPELTPHFDLAAFYGALDAAREAVGVTGTATETSEADERQDKPWALGDALLYGEAVTSTQTMLERNPNFHYALPTPLVSLAYAQLSGRGRGGNVWLSPAGCLQFSVLLRVPVKEVQPQKLVFVQYLFALAVAEACEDEGVLGKYGRKVRIKWPNDVYAETGGYTQSGEKEVKKIGGILVNTSFGGADADVIIGSGLNVLNEPPILSLAQLLPSTAANAPTLECTAAAILAHFAPMWDEFVAGRGSFAPFMNRYLARWLHSDQLVTITTVDPPQRARIVGITEQGLLRAMPERTTGSIARGYGARGGFETQFIDLQPDGNSFDIMSGMIKAKR